MTTLDPALSDRTTSKIRRSEILHAAVGQLHDTEVAAISGSELRIVHIVARDPATKTCSIGLTDDDVADTERWKAGILCQAGVVPIVGRLAYAMTNTTDWIVIGLVGTDALPRGKMRSTATQNTAVAGTPEKFNFNAAGGSTEYDTDNDGAATMVDRTNSRIYARWPGVYGYGYHSHLVPGGGTFNRFTDVKLNNTTFLPPRLVENPDTLTDWSLSDERLFAAGDFIELFITTQTVAGITFGTNSNELGMNLWMSYRP